MARSLRLHLDQPCSEDWSGMAAGGPGRFCASCRKTVTDFTAMSDAELAAYLRKHGGRGCGRFTSSQLGRDLLLPRPAFPGIRYLVQVNLPALLLAAEAGAQAPVPDATVQSVPRTPAAPLPAAARRMTVSGTVTDTAGNPIPFATITEPGLRHPVQVDASGAFELRLLAPTEVRVSATGYHPQDVRITATGIGVQLQRNSFQLEEVIVGGYIARPSRRARKIAAPAPPVAAINVYPNPVSAGVPVRLEASHLKPGAYHLELLTAAGQPVASAPVTVSGKRCRLELPVPDLPAGNYLLNLIPEGSKERFSKVVQIRH